MKKIAILCITLIASTQTMKNQIRVKIASRDVLKSRIVEGQWFDEYFGEKTLKPIYDLADQERDPKEVIDTIQLLIQQRNNKIKAFEDANPNSHFHWMTGLDKEFTREFIKVLFKDHPAVLKTLQQ